MVCLYVCQCGYQCDTVDVSVSVCMYQYMRKLEGDSLHVLSVECGVSVGMSVSVSGLSVRAVVWSVVCVSMCHLFELLSAVVEKF